MIMFTYPANCGCWSLASHEALDWISIVYEQHSDGPPASHHESYFFLSSAFDNACSLMAMYYIIVVIHVIIMRI